MIQMRSITDMDLSSKKVILRCDYNVPIKDGIIEDDTRIRMSLDTINYLLKNNCKIIILSHLGKIKEESDKAKNSLYPVSIRLGELLHKNILFSKDTRSDELTKMASNLKEKEILLVENTRYEDLNSKKESSCDMDLASYWASLGEVFINDAYGTLHRAHASNVGIAKILPSAVGFLVLNELNKIDSLLEENTNPFIVIMGGKKVSDKIKVIDNLITKCDKLLIGGGMAYTFLASLGYDVGSSLIDTESLDYAKNILINYKNKIVLPVDAIVATEISPEADATNKNIDSILDNEIALDIGSETIKLFEYNLQNAKRVIMNGPMGVFEIEKFSHGTKAIYEYLTKNNIKTIIGGGDSASSVNKLGYTNKFYHVSTGGGATLEYLEGKTLPGLSVIEDGK